LVTGPFGRQDMTKVADATITAHRRNMDMGTALGYHPGSIRGRTDYARPPLESPASRGKPPARPLA
jgi:hypothetical protein